MLLVAGYTAGTSLGLVSLAARSLPPAHCPLPTIQLRRCWRVDALNLGHTATPQNSDNLIVVREIQNVSSLMIYCTNSRRPLILEGYVFLA
jgi:hypothetical protein